MRRVGSGRATIAVLAGIAALVVSGCNLITGADALTLDADAGAGPVHGGKQPDAPAQPGEPEGGSTPAAALVGAPGVSVRSIELNQGVSRFVAHDGEIVSGPVPVLAGRAAFVRAHYETDGSYDGGSVTARLVLDDTRVLEQVVALGPVGSVDFVVGADGFGAQTTLRAELLQPRADAAAENPLARLPAAGAVPIPLNAKSAPSLKLTLVPVRYDADGSGRLPDTSTPQLEAYANRFYAMYPVSEVAITVRQQPLVWSVSTGAGGSGWEQLLEAIADLRASDGAADDAYYYGVFAPGPSFESYCASGCMAGLGYLGAPSAPYARAAIGLGFSGDVALDTAVHELGHNHGREHAPCGGAAGADPKFPYANGAIGTAGYDVLTGEQFGADAGYADVMGYCWPIWISDYTFTRIFQHATAIAGASINVPPAMMNREYHRLRIDGEGNLTWLTPVKLATPPMGEQVAVTIATSEDAEDVPGSLFRFDHLPGGTLLVPKSTSLAASIKSLEAIVDGKKFFANASTP